MIFLQKVEKSSILVSLPLTHREAISLEGLQRIEECGSDEDLFLQTYELKKLEEIVNLFKQHHGLDP
ncbi:unnamed protein product [Arabidopsis halleri]